MRRIATASLFVVFLVIPAIGFSQDARTILQTAQEKQLQRWSGVDLYVIEQSIAGNRASSYFRRFEVSDDAGNKQTVFMPVEDSGMAADQCGAVQMSPEAWEAYADSAEMVGAGMGYEIEEGLEDAGLPRGLLAATGSSPQASFDPRVMMGSNARFARGIAEAQRHQAGAAKRDAASAEESADQMMQFITTARLIGTEKIDGRNAFHLRSEDIRQVHEADGQEFAMNAISMWFDAEEYVPLQMKVDGTITSAGETRPMTIENAMLDYRKVPGSNMYESYKRVMKIGGMMDAAQEAQMREAQVKMAEFEKQLASMPESQRQMMQSMMGPQLEQMRSMTSGGGFQTEVIVNSITVNPAPPGQSAACPGGSVQQVATSNEATDSTMTMEQRMTIMVQENLLKLGYNPGNTSGEVTKETVVAISRFQADKNMEVTGQVTPQLAGILAAAADRQN